MVSVAPILLGVGSPLAHAGVDERPSVQAPNSALTELPSTVLRELPSAALRELSSTALRELTSSALDVSSSALLALASSSVSELEPSGLYPRPVLKAMALTVVPLDQFFAFDEIITAESGWRVFAINPSSGAYGLPQALPAHKMSSEGFDWMINPMTQLRWAYRYMNERYGSPTAAWAFWQAHHWY